MNLYNWICICRMLFKANWRIMTISDRRSADEPEILVQERIAELEKANQELSRRQSCS